MFTRGVMSVLVAVLATGCTVEYKPAEDGSADAPATPRPSAEEERLGHDDFRDAVLFTGGQSATLADGWDYESCAEVESGPSLSEAGCRYAVELRFVAGDEGSQYQMLLLAAPDGAQSEGTQEFAAALDPADAQPRDDAILDDSAAEATTVAAMAEGFALIGVASTRDADIDIRRQLDYAASSLSDTLEHLDGH